jgi:hypothetical protein
MGVDVAQLLDRLKASPVFIFFGLLLLLLSSLITVSSGPSVLINFYRSTIGRKGLLLGQLDRLSTGVNLSYFESLLGPPVFSESLDGLREYIFVSREFYVQAITNLETSVVAFSVTTRKKGFNPGRTLARDPRTGKIARVCLGKTRFVDTDHLVKPSRVYCNLGAKCFSYCEEIPYGGAGNFQTVVLAINEAGYRDHPLFTPGNGYWTSAEDPEVKTFRSDAVVNTYMVTSPYVTLTDLKRPFPGPDYQRVHVSNMITPPSWLERASNRITLASWRGRRRYLKFLQVSPYEYFNNPKYHRRAGRWC